MYKLTILNIIIEACWFPFKYKLQFLNALALPVLLVVCVGSAWQMVKPEGPVLNWLIYLIYYLSLSYFAISCHRLILMSRNGKVSQRFVPMLKRIFVFSVWVIVVYIAAGIPYTVILTIAINISPDSDFMSTSHNITAANFNWIKLLLSLFYAYFLGRLSLVFPATAVDVSSSIKWSWRATKNNGMRIMVLIGGIPLVSTILLNLLWRENGTMFEYMFLTILGYLVVAIEIFILSIVFRELYRAEQH